MIQKVELTMGIQPYSAKRGIQMDEVISYLKQVLDMQNREINGEEDLKQEVQAYYRTHLLNQKEELLQETVEKTFSDSGREYLWILSYLHWIFPKQWYLDQIAGVIKRGDFNPYTSLSIWKQIARGYFVNTNLNCDYSSGRETWDILIEQMKTELAFTDYGYIPIEKRDRDTIVIIVTQLLSVWHAPSKIAVNFCSYLQTKLRKKVLLVSMVENVLQDNERSDLYKNFRCSVHSPLFPEGKIVSTAFEGITEVPIPIYQVLVKKENRKELVAAMRHIYNLAPYCVWNIGAPSLLAELTRDFTTLIAMPCSREDNITNADIVVDYFGKDSERGKRALSYMREAGQQVKKIPFAHPFAPPDELILKSDVGLPEDSFVLGVVGRRLEIEVTDEFLERIYPIWKEYSQVWILMIGVMDKKKIREQLKRAGINARFLLMKEKKKLINYLSLSDISLNPPRQGGGCGCHWGMSLGVPVVTLDIGDVAASCGEAFLCDNFEEYTQTIERYIKEPLFYQKQSELARKTIEQQVADGDRLVEIIEEILDCVK